MTDKPHTPRWFQRMVTNRGVRVNGNSYDCRSVQVGTDVCVFLVSEEAVVAHLFSSDQEEYLGEAIREGTPSPRPNVDGESDGANTGVINEYQVADPETGQWRLANPLDVMAFVERGWPVRVFLENCTLWNLVEDEMSIGRMPEPSAVPIMNGNGSQWNGEQTAPAPKVRGLNEVADVPTRQEAGPLEEQHQPGEGTTSTSALLQTSYPPERHPGDTEREPQAREDSSSCSPSEMASDNHTITAAENGV